LLGDVLGEAFERLDGGESQAVALDDQSFVRAEFQHGDRRGEWQHPRGYHVAADDGVQERAFAALELPTDGEGKAVLGEFHL
jgi:hypothetical protein